MDEEKELILTESECVKEFDRALYRHDEQGYNRMRQAKRAIAILQHAKTKAYYEAEGYIKLPEGIEIPKYQLKIKKKYRSDGSLYEMLLYCEPNSGHGWKPIARFYTEFTDAVENADRIVALWNALSLIRQDKE